MVTSTLVDRQIEDGRLLVNRLVKNGFDVTVAFWAKSAESGLWSLYIASTAREELGLKESYKAVIDTIQGLTDPWISSLDIKIISANDPRTKDVLEFQRLHPRRVSPEYGRNQIGGYEIEDAYIYPPADPNEERWRGIEVMVFRDPNEADSYRVEFWPHELQALRGWGGEPRRVPWCARVKVKVGAGGEVQVTDYRPPEKPDPRLRQEDYEQKALAAVRQVAGKPD